MLYIIINDKGIVVSEPTSNFDIAVNNAKKHAQKSQYGMTYRVAEVRPIFAFSTKVIQEDV